MCEMSQTSGGGGPPGSPPHARMTSSVQPSMQLHIFDDVGLSRLQRLFDLHVSVKFCEPFPVYRGHLGCICISCTKILWYKSLLLFQAQHICGIHHSIFLARIYASMYFMVRFLVYWTSYSFVLCLGGHRYASPLPLAHVPSHKIENCCTCKSHFLRV